MPSHRLPTNDNLLEIDIALCDDVDMAWIDRLPVDDALIVEWLPPTDTEPLDQPPKLEPQTIALKSKDRFVRLCSVDACTRFAQRHNLCFRHGGRRACQEPDCTKKDRGNGYCVAHGGGEVCQFHQCTRRARANHLCNKHRK
ncbi:Aste57867_2808 [Aphanomyces stellatus]|uniref:Aste57867_2808 protein n=1 Tax=Aphanomyces stellatus TaxID=120398 RepID=A0A485KA03_9STRA|nr:hypothetical protein As57867_002801 [Aphanomyces stellatus]VFT79997.1 Aste57867_2808 [Aphanomyces stellatus]